MKVELEPLEGMDKFFPPSMSGKMSIGRLHAECKDRSQVAGCTVAFIEMWLDSRLMTAFIVKFITSPNHYNAYSIFDVATGRPPLAHFSGVYCELATALFFRDYGVTRIRTLVKESLHLTEKEKQRQEYSLRRRSDGVPVVAFNEMDEFIHNNDQEPLTWTIDRIPEYDGNKYELLRDIHGVGHASAI